VNGGGEEEEEEEKKKKKKKHEFPDLIGEIAVGTLRVAT
jgi:hypothetical protein